MYSAMRYVEHTFFNKLRQICANISMLLLSGKELGVSTLKPLSLHAPKKKYLPYPFPEFEDENIYTLVITILDLSHLELIDVDYNSCKTAAHIKIT